MSTNENLKKQLRKYRDLLSNLSRRNRELYYKEAKGTSINFSMPPVGKNHMQENCPKDFVGMSFSSPEFADFLRGVDINLNDFFLLDFYKNKEMSLKLFDRIEQIRLADDKHQKELGISGAWILGPFLCWRNSMNYAFDELIVTPVFKTAIDLHKNKKKQLTLQCEADSLELNATFRLAIKQAFGIEFNENQSFDTATQYVDNIVSILENNGKKVIRHPSKLLPKVPSKFKLVRDESGEVVERIPVKLEDILSGEEQEIYNKTTGSEFVLLDILYLDQLNASRAVLINDYDDIINKGLGHPILNELFNGVPNVPEPQFDRSKLRELDTYKEKLNHFVVDIDSTQHRAIDKATKSKAIVIQGPPGSGKSQTIVNLIADYLSRGKKVLFVSEKRPALDVVHNRMKGANIDNQAVLIHGSDLNKKELYKSFLTLADITPNVEEQKSWYDVADNLDRIKNDINCYADILQSEHRGSGLKIQEIIFLANTIDKSLYSPLLAKLFPSMTYKNMEILGSYLDQIQTLLGECDGFQSSPWIHKKINVLPTAELKYAVKSISDRISEVKRLINSSVAAVNDFALLQKQYNLNNEVNMVYFDSELDSITGLFQGSSIALSQISEVQSTIQHLKNTINENKFLASNINQNLDLRTCDELIEYYRVTRGVMSWFDTKFWTYKKIRKKFCQHWDGTNKQFIAYSKYKTALDKLYDLHFGLRSKFNSIPFSDVSQLIDNVDEQNKRLDLLRRFLLENKKLINENKLAKSLLSVENFQQVQIEIREIMEHISDAEKYNKELATQFHFFSRYLLVLPDLESIEHADKWASNLYDRINDLNIFDQADLLIQKAREHIGEEKLHEKIASNFYGITASWSASIFSSMMQLWLDEIMQTYPVLRNFNRKKMEGTYGHFLEYLNEHQHYSRVAIVQDFANRWNSPQADKSGLSLLAKESAKQRKILSPREIMEKGALNTMLQLKSCWLMSPLSISQILPLKASLFDVIIFDEASQVRVEDAIPSIYRASTMIVVGDDKQMPPTAFFSSSISDEEDEEHEEIAPSVLDLATQMYPSVLLEWHYRSRSEALIAFSNRAFYGGRLITAPNPETLTSSGAISFYNVEDAYFNSRDGNIVEASAVVDKLIQQIKNNPNQSYGIIALGAVQSSVLQGVLEKKMNQDSQVYDLIEQARLFKHGDADAGLFIKNLENVQGDERDVIFLSFGYAPSGPGKKLRLSFGPLSVKGGGRRLNVAITRAKTKMHVFCSFHPGDLLTDEDTFAKNPDFCCVGRYLKYAEAVTANKNEAATAILNTFPMSGVITSRKSSRFSMDVKRKLEELGYEVSSEIGTSGFYIDLAIHHPTIPSNFMVGIECDGAIFHSTPYARDRDKIRQNLLESRGWKILRVWSQDWSNDWRKELTRLDSFVKEIQKIPEKFRSS